METVNQELRILVSEYHATQAEQEYLEYLDCLLYHFIPEFNQD
jgi:hypothetical protein